MANIVKTVVITTGSILLAINGMLGCSSGNNSNTCLDQDQDQVCKAGADNISGNQNDDCDDTDASVYPNAVEVCDHKDNDCDGSIDEAEAADASTWYQDSDEDGFGNPDLTLTACNQPEGYVADSTDCDDARTDVYPQATELACDGIDNDCDPATSDQPDVDEDGYNACDDCDDQAASIHPHAIELPNDKIDQNCDGKDRCTDLNCDGWTDMVISNHHNNGDYSTQSYSYWGSSSGFAAENRAGLPSLGANDNSIADLNGDGYLDIVFSNHTNGCTYQVDSFIYWGGPGGYLEDNRTDLPTTGAWGNSVADLNTDGYLDIVFSNTRDDNGNFSLNSYVYWGSSSGFTINNRTELPTVGAAGNNVADLNGDGYLDIVFSNHQDGNSARIDSYVYWGSESGFEVENRTELPSLGSVANCLSDIDGDSFLEVVFSNRYDDTTSNLDSYIYWGSAAGFSVEQRNALPTIGSQACSIADLDDDGYKDIVFSNAQDDDQELFSYIYWGNQQGYSEADRTGLPTRAAYENQIADINEDGFLDIVFSSRIADYEEENQSIIYWGSNGGYSSQNRTYLPTLGASGISIAGSSLSLPVTETSINLSVDKVIMSQGVDIGLFTEQDLGTVTVPRIKGRPTIVRAFIKVARDGGATLNVGARLHGQLSGAPLPGSPLETSLTPVPLSPSTNNWSDSLNFTLPATWIVSGASFYLEIDFDDQYEESNETDNRAPLHGDLSFGFEKHNPFDLLIVPVIQGGLTPNPGAYPEIEDWIKWVYPVPSLNTEIHTPVTYTGDPVAPNGTNWASVLDFVTTLRGAETSRPDLYYYGVLDPGYTSGVTGLAWVPYLPSFPLPVAVGTDDITTAGKTAAHEIGHNHGRHHVPGCQSPSGLDPNYPYPDGQIGVVGWKLDTLTLLDKDIYADIMSYCDEVWISDYNYKAFFDWEVATQSESYSYHQTFAKRVFFLSGSILDGQVISARAFDLLEHPETPDQGDYLLELVDGRGTIIAAKRFAAFPTDNVSSRHGFIVKVDRTDLEIKGYRIIDPKGRILADHQRTASMPEAKISYAGTTGWGTSMIAWQENLYQELMRVVMVYNQSANRWEVLSLGGEQQFFEWKNPTPQNATRVRIIISDGISSDITETTF